MKPDIYYYMLGDDLYLLHMGDEITEWEIDDGIVSSIGTEYSPIEWIRTMAWGLTTFKLLTVDEYFLELL